jgi:hypothetical protein
MREAQCEAGWSGVKVFPCERCPGRRLTPHPVEHLAMLDDPPPSGEGKHHKLRCPRATARAIWPVT